MKQILWLAIWECFSSKNNIENFVISQIIQKIKNKPWLNFIGGGASAPPTPISTPVGGGEIEFYNIDKEIIIEHVDDDYTTNCRRATVSQRRGQK